MAGQKKEPRLSKSALKPVILASGPVTRTGLLLVLGLNHRSDPGYSLYGIFTLNDGVSRNSQMGALQIHPLQRKQHELADEF